MSHAQQQPGHSSQSDGPASRRNRRQLLALGGTATAAATVAALGLAHPNKTRAATNDALILGQSNNIADQPTKLEKMQTPTGVWTAAFEVLDNVEGAGVGHPCAIAIQGVTTGGIGVVGSDTSTGIGVHGKSESGAGVNGMCGDGPGVVGEAPGGHPGVRAESRAHVAPYGLDGGLALEVLGKASFSTSSAGTVPRGARMARVANAAVTAASHITVTLTGNPGFARFDWVERQPGVGFVVHLAGLSRSEIPFTYLIVEPRG